MTDFHPSTGSSDSTSHSLRYFYTGVSGINFPEFTVVGLVDEVQTEYYDSNIRKMIPKTEWMEKNKGEDFWNRETNNIVRAQEDFKTYVSNLMERLNQTEGVQTVQRMYGCELHDDGTKTGYFQFGYDGEDWLSFDLNTVTFTAANAKAVINKHSWDTWSTTSQAQYVKYYLETECIDWLQDFVGHGRFILERKVSPEMSLFQKDSSSPVVCHATGFFPKAVMISWQKDGEDLHEDVELRETLPNLDDTFQKRSVLSVSPEELDKHDYTCIIQHSSLEKEVVLKMSDLRVLSGGGSVGIIVSAVMVVLLFVVIVFVGVFIWKKKPGFLTVPGNPNARQ
ncbi:hypothetical protein SRHO_G00258390 [Serrasalmus rhombeus]